MFLSVSLGRIQIVNWRMKAIVLLFCVVFGRYILSIQSCSVGKLIQPTELVDNSNFIVRAKAINYTTSSNYGNLSITDSKIRFRIREVLKNSDNRRVPRPIIINGYLTQKDNFNDAELPYLLGRSDEYNSLCFAYTYKQNAEYLLFLNDKNSPYDEMYLAPVNEQLHLPTNTDPWYQWVKNQLSISTTTSTSAPLDIQAPIAMKSAANKLRLFGFL